MSKYCILSRITDLDNAGLLLHLNAPIARLNAYKTGTTYKEASKSLIQYIATNNLKLNYFSFMCNLSHKEYTPYGRKFIEYIVQEYGYCLDDKTFTMRPNPVTSESPMVKLPLRYLVKLPLRYRDRFHNRAEYLYTLDILSKQ